MNYIEKIRRAIECPQFGNENYGEWGTLNLEQRKYIRKLLYDLDIADNCSKDLYFENKQLKDNWNKLKEIIKKKFVAQGGFTSYEWNDLLNELLDKMQELEGSDNDE